MSPLHGRMASKSAPQFKHEEHRKGRKREDEKANRPFTDSGRAPQVPQTTPDHNRQRPGIALPTGRQRGVESSQV